MRISLFQRTDDAGGRPGAHHPQQESPEKTDSLAERRELVAQRAALQRSMEQVVASLRVRETAAQQTLAERQRAAEEAEREAEAAADAVASAALSHETAIGVVEAALRRSASPRIARFVGELHGQTKRVHEAFWFREARLYRGDIIVENNEAEILDRLERIRGARAAAERLALEALSEDELTARLAELRESLHKSDAEEMRWRARDGLLGARGA